jgi:hypothetical protein
MGSDRVGYTAGSAFGGTGAGFAAIIGLLSPKGADLLANSWFLAALAGMCLGLLVVLVTGARHLAGILRKVGAGNGVTGEGGKGGGPGGGEAGGGPMGGGGGGQGGRRGGDGGTGGIGSGGGGGGAGGEEGGRGGDGGPGLIEIWWQEPAPALDILKAEYGAGDTWTDVTDTVRRSVVNDRLDILVTNAIFGYILHGIGKSLKIECRWNGREMPLVAFDEGKQAVLPLVGW